MCTHTHTPPQLGSLLLVVSRILAPSLTTIFLFCVCEVLHCIVSTPPQKRFEVQFQVFWPSCTRARVLTGGRARLVYRTVGLE